MTNKKNINEEFHTNEGFIIEEHGHPSKMSRRQLLAQGFIKGSGVALAPSVLSTLAAKRAFGCDDKIETTGNEQIPVMFMDLGGGGNLVGPNIVPGTRDGQSTPVGDLKPLGIANDQISEVKDFGLSWHNESMILKGMQGAFNRVFQDQASGIKDKVKGLVFASRSRDDDSSNPINPSHLLLKAGINGALTPFIAANGTAAGSPRSKLPNGTAIGGMTPIVMNRSSDAASLVKKHALAESLSPDALDKILKAATRMSESSLCEFNKKSLSEQLKAVCGCKHEKSLSVMTKFSENNVTPALDPEIQRIFGDRREQSIATYAKLLANGYAGLGVRLEGGYDYHNGTRSVGDAKDLKLGDEIGSMLAYAATINKPLAIIVTTDGGVLSDGSGENGYNGNLNTRLNTLNRGDLYSLVRNERLGQKLVWNTDANNTRGAIVMFVYHPKGVKQRKAQIGAYQNAGVVAEVNAISASLPNTVAAITANWLALHGREGEIKKLIDSGINGNLDEYLGFEKIG